MPSRLHMLRAGHSSSVGHRSVLCSICVLAYFLLSPKGLFLLILERGREQETPVSCLLYAPRLGIEPATFWSTRRHSDRASRPEPARRLSFLHPNVHLSSKHARVMCNHKPHLKTRMRALFQKRAAHQAGRCQRRDLLGHLLLQTPNNPAGRSRHCSFCSTGTSPEHAGSSTWLVCAYSYKPIYNL